MRSRLSYPPTGFPTAQSRFIYRLYGPTQVSFIDSQPQVFSVSAKLRHDQAPAATTVSYLVVLIPYTRILVKQPEPQVKTAFIFFASLHIPYMHLYITLCKEGRLRLAARDTPKHPEGLSFCCLYLSLAL